MAKANILCDASYNEDLQLGGFSGGFQLVSDKGDWNDMYHGVCPDVGNSNEAEMLAIAGGARKLAEKLKEHNDHIDSLDIYTDSYTAINQYGLYKDNEQHDPKYDSAVKMMDKYLAPIVNIEKIAFHHVNAHVSPEKATPLETFHNLVDKNALTIRWRAQNHIFKPELDKGLFYGVVLPVKPRADQTHDLKQLGYAYAKKGFKARVAFLGKNRDAKNHPFLQGVSLAAKDLGVSPKSLVTVEGWVKNGGRENGCEGLDRTLIRHHYRQSGKYARGVNFNIAPFMFAAEASRVMYGKQAEDPLNSVHLTGRKEAASQFVINIVDGSKLKNDRPTYTNEWLSKFTEYTNVPIQVGLKAAMNALELTNEIKLQDANYSIKNAMKEVVYRYCGQLESNQVMGKVIEALHNEGCTLSRQERESVQECVDKFSNRPKRTFDEVTSIVLNSQSVMSESQLINSDSLIENNPKFETHDSPKFEAHEAPQRRKKQLRRF